MSSILRFILMNPRTVFAALCAAVALAMAGGTAFAFKSVELDAWKARAVAAEATVEAQTNASQAIADAAELRAQTAERAAEAAREAGKADRRAAQVYLNMPTPAPAERCDAAQRLVDAAIAEARQ